MRVTLPRDDVGVSIGLFVEEASDSNAGVVAAFTGEMGLLGSPRCLLGHLREASSDLSLLVQFRKIRLLVIGWGALRILSHVVYRGLVVAAASLLGYRLRSMKALLSVNCASSRALWIVFRARISWVRFEPLTASVVIPRMACLLTCASVMAPF